ncbi:MAG: heme exporter protein CcmD [Slackia sp.]|nr:heme exporter protein CcmD [Slackia sp.]
MDPILAEIYSTVLDAAPFVIAAYALLFLVLCGYVAYIMTKLKRTEKKLAALEEHLDESK